MRKDKIMVIVKRPDETLGHMETVNNDLKTLQGLVGGYIETVELDSGTVLICNENGKNFGLDTNFCIRTPYWADWIMGTAVIVGTDGEEFADCPISLDGWKKWLKEWGMI